MPIELIHPEALPRSEIYHQVAVATGGRTVYLAGQVARTATGEPVGAGDLATQVEQACLNVAAALAAVGGTFADVAKVTVYVVDWTPDKMPSLGAGFRRACQALEQELGAPITLIGVVALGEPDLLVEVDVTAVLA
ncbi:RidA family protein [Nakamurella deserti]|uniref:RidA family protein n=1 Tax=Nakamurella deserti TaxID=2164074 RepID=UPI000DBE814D|nr:RidA family protein [Nakamurella deserti]